MFRGLTHERDGTLSIACRIRNPDFGDSDRRAYKTVPVAIEKACVITGHDQNFTPYWPGPGCRRSLSPNYIFAMYSRHGVAFMVSVLACP